MLGNLILLAAPLVIAAAVLTLRRELAIARPFVEAIVVSAVAIAVAAVVHFLPLGGLQEGVFFAVALLLAPASFAIGALGVWWRSLEVDPIVAWSLFPAGVGAAMLATVWIGLPWDFVRGIATVGFVLGAFLIVLVALDGPSGLARRAEAAR